MDNVEDISVNRVDSILKTYVLPLMDSGQVHEARLTIEKELAYSSRLLESTRSFAEKIDKEAGDPYDLKYMNDKLTQYISNEKFYKELLEILVSGRAGLAKDQIKLRLGIS